MAVTTINPTYTAEEVEYQLQDSGAQILFTLPELLPTAQAGSAKTKVRSMRQNRAVGVGSRWRRHHVCTRQVRRIFCLGATGTAAAPPLRTLYTQPAPAYPRPPVAPQHDTAIICYSSGTTGTRPRARPRPRLQLDLSHGDGWRCAGRSKGVELSHFNLVANIVQTSSRDRLYTTSDDVWHAVLPMYGLEQRTMVWSDGG